MFARTCALFLLLFPVCLPAQVRLLIVGNTADATPDYYRTLSERITAAGPAATVLIAGDLVPECSGEMRAYRTTRRSGAFPTVTPLIDLVRRHPNTTFYAVPGDRDWDESGKDGLRCVRALEAYLADQQLPNFVWPLANGCPGPEVLDLSASVRLVLLNTQWWNHPFDRPVPADKACDFSDPSISYDEIISELEEHRDQNVIIAGHYPPVSQGRRGGKFPTRDHLTPPLFGSFRVSFRQNIGTPLELTNRRFQVLARKLTEYNSQFEGLLFVGAQDRSQQLLGFGRNHVINAGAAADGQWVAKHEPALHTTDDPGITEVVFAADGSVVYGYYPVSEDQSVRTDTLYHAPCDSLNADVRVNPAFPPCPVLAAPARSAAARNRDTLVGAPGPLYTRKKAGRFFLGKNYRDVWATPVKFPVLDLDAPNVDLRPVRQGGSRQTTSLILAAADGEEYTFRSLNRDASGTFDYQIRNTVVGEAIRDQTSSSYPYGGLVIGRLLDPLDILHPDPEAYALTRGDTLGRYSEQFGGLVGTLELRPQGARDDGRVPGTYGANEILQTFELFRERYDDQEVVIDEEEYLRARLFDLLVGDWAMQEDGLRWAQFGTEGNIDQVERIRPIPVNRDAAFSRLGGLLSKVISRYGAFPNLENFELKQPSLRGLTYGARHMDRLLLAPLTREQFTRQARVIRESLPDSVLRAAVSRIPAPATPPKRTERPERVLAYRAEQELLYEKLRRRRDELERYAEDYYDLHARVVDVVGTNDEEAFLLEAFDDGRLRVTSTDVKGKSAGKVLYDRTFLPGETKEVRIYGLGDDDQFRTVGPVGKRIRVKLIGGEGEDVYADDGGGAERTRVYDKTLAGYTGRSAFRFQYDWRDELYYYDRTAFEYNKTGPIVGVGFNSYSGVQGKLGIQHLRTSYRRRDLSKRYRLFVEAGALGNLAVEGSAEFAQAIRYADIVASSRIGQPEFYNFFFGLGNNSELIPDTDRNDFNLVRLDHFDVQVGLRRRYATHSFFNLWFGYQNNKTTDRENTILDREDRFYGDGEFTYGIIRPEFVLDLRDHPVFPVKGVLLEASHKQGIGNARTESFGVTRVAAEFHISTRRFPIGLSFRTGWAKSWGLPPFYELPSLGRANGLRGFQRNRFTGDGYFFHNTELRLPLASVRSRVVPFAIGLRAFFDRGRIIQDDDGSNKFKTAYGGGLYVIPTSKSFTLSALLGWSEEESALISLGIGTAF